MHREYIVQMWTDTAGWHALEPFFKQTLEEAIVRANDVQAYADFTLRVVRVSNYTRSEDPMPVSVAWVPRRRSD